LHHFLGLREAHMNIQGFNAACVSIAALAMSACAMTSDGLELKPEGAGAQALVTIDWSSSDDFSGTMTASLPDGRLFIGSYVWITAETQVELLEPLWQGWTAGYGWRHWQSGPDFARYYSGEILASLRAANGERMRCRFRTVDRSSGMSGGGEGKCQFASGNTLAASFAPAQPA
jgi:hypothetical protein